MFPTYPYNMYNMYYFVCFNIFMQCIIVIRCIVIYCHVLSRYYTLCFYIDMRRLYWFMSFGYNYPDNSYVYIILS